LSFHLPSHGKASQKWRCLFSPSRNLEQIPEPH
jgi:hypothetical protein